MSILTENWHAWYTGGADSEFRLRFWNFDPKIHFWTNLGQKIESCPIGLKIGTHTISRMLIPNQDIDFWNFAPKIHFWANLDPKNSKLSVLSKIGALGILKTLILIPTLVLWISNPNFLFGQIWAKKSKLSVLTENWHTWYLGSVDSKSILIFLKF